MVIALGGGPALAGPPVPGTGLVRARCMTEHPQRLESFDYRGQHTYHLQFCTDDRQPLFTDRAAVELALSQFRRSASEQQFALLAYCFMPDHVHLVVQGASDAADLKAFASKAKQYSWYAYA